MRRLILLRHGQSLWNLENKFTGWTDVDLCDHGKLEARKAGRLLKAEGYSFDVAYTSDDEVAGLNIPTGLPLVYELEDDLKIVDHYNLGEEEI